MSQADDLFGTAAERFRVGLGARVDDRVIRGVNAARHIGWQEQQLVLDFFVSNALMTAISPSSTVGRLSGQTFVASVVEFFGGGTCTRRRNLTDPFSSDARRLSASAFGGRFAASSSLT